MGLAGEGAGRWLETRRLVLRPLSLADAADAHRLFDADPEVWAFEPGAPMSRAERERWVEIRAHEAHTPTGRAGLFGRALVLGASGGLVGCAGLSAVVVPGGLAAGGDDGPGLASLEVELWYRLGRAHWGRGYATEACRRLLRLAFEEVGLPRVFCATQRGNARSLALLARLGLERPRHDRPPGPFWGADPAWGLFRDPRPEAATAPRAA